MSELTTNHDQVAQESSLIQDFLVLAKPRISVMVLLTVAVAGIVSLPIAAANSPGLMLVHAMIGLFFVSASGCAWNQYLERYVDWLMPRTAKRPLPGQRLSALQVAVFGAVTLGIGIAWLVALVNWQSAAIAMINWVFYVCLYTPLKVRTWLNTYVGAVAGALPVLIGSTAICNGAISVGAWTLFAVIFVWQFPHFMAIAWLYRRDYQLAQVKMATTVDDTGRLAGRHAIFFAAALVPIVAAAAWPSSMLGVVFQLVVIALSVWYLWASIQFANNVCEASSRKLFRVSLLYLPAYLVGLSIVALV